MTEIGRNLFTAPISPAVKGRVLHKGVLIFQRLQPCARWNNSERLHIYTGMLNIRRIKSVCRLVSVL